MFSKNNLKCILILAIGFFWCSSLYLSQEQYLSRFADANFVNNVDLLYGSFSMALGILLFGILYRNNKNIKIYYTIFMILSIISMITFFIIDNIYVMSVCMCLACLFGTAGFGAGYHFSLLGSNVSSEYRGRIFAIGYGLGSIGTYLIILLPESFYASINSLFIYVPMVLINLFIVLKYTKLEEIIKEKMSTSFKTYFIRTSIIVISMSLLSALATDVIALHTIQIPGGYGATRIYYCVGLLIAGFLTDKRNNIFEILTIVSFIFALLSIILLKDDYSINIISALSYFLVAFFVLYRTMSFVNMTDNKKSMAWVCAFGLMYSRIMEGLLVFFEDDLINNYTLLIIVMIMMLSIVIILYFLFYSKNNNQSEKDIVKSIVIKCQLSVQEEKVLNLLVKDYSNQEIADELYISTNTVRNHVASIYKKTGMKKKELKEKCYYGTN